MLPGEIDMFGKLVKWLKIPVARVPEEIAVCEFDCARQECRLENWEQCPRRLDACNSRGSKYRQPHA